jgi:hypothetical protein
VKGERGGGRSVEALALREGEGALLLPIRVRARAGREGVEGIHGDRLLVAVREAPERGRANEAVLALLADRIGVSRRGCALIRGEASRDKLVRIEGLLLEEGRRRLRRALEGGA